MKKRVLAALLTLVVAVGAVGCGDTNKKNPTNSADGRTHYRIVTTRHTTAWSTDFLHEGIMKELEDKYNIYIDWEIYSMSDWAEQKSLMFAGDDYADAFLGSTTLSDNDVQNGKEIFVELTDLIKENMPNLSRIMEEDNEIKTCMLDRNGDIYSLPKKLPLRAATANVPYINKKWLDNLGLDMPDTYKDLEAVLQAFKDQDADGDGDPNNEIPYTYPGSLNVDARHILSCFGTITSRAGNYMGLDINGNPFFLPIQENYKDAVVWMHGLYEKGLIDSEYFTQDTAMYSGKLQATGGSMVGLLWGWTADSEAGVNESEFVPMPAVKGPDGNRYVESDPTYLDISNRELVITNNCENPELLLQWADEFYTDIVSLQTYFGSIPDQVSDNGDGTYTLLPPKDGMSYGVTAWSYSLRDYGPKYMSDEFEKNVILPPNGGDGKKLAQDINAEYARPNFPVVKYTDEQSQRLAMLLTDISGYVEQQYAHWVVDGGIEDEWDTYLDTLDRMGVKEMLAIQEDAYNYYLSMQK